MSRASTPADARAVVALMKDALVEARVGLSQVRDALALTEKQLEHERAELATTQRRGKLAADVNDAETVSVAARFAAKQTERIAVLERKLEAQRGELDLVEREVGEMTMQLKQAAANPSGVGGTPKAPDLGEPPDESDKLRRDIDRAARESTAERQLDELKRRMGR
ncbi:MAG: hypothetical protein M3081_09740 [Gemmatimonadota bacterium]|nr:hypothetical protein [Gemmatimonadota bacterium]